MNLNPFNHIPQELKNETVPKNKFLAHISFENFMLRYPTGAVFFVYDDGISLTIRRDLKHDSKLNGKMTACDKVKYLLAMGVTQLGHLVFFTRLHPETVKKYVAEIQETGKVE